jgi:hypothetical protein
MISLLNLFILLTFLTVFINCGFHTYTADIDFLEFEGKGREFQEVDFRDEIKDSLKKIYEDNS